MRASRAARWAGLWALGALVASPAAAQYRHPVDDAMIQSVMPAAASFSEKQGLPPVYTAYGPSVDGSPGPIVGYVYLTSNVPPAEYGYSSRIDVLVGMDLQGAITGIHIVDYRESLSSSRGDFLRGAGLEEQVVGKHITEAFQLGRDLHGVSGASISSRAMFRGVRNSARRVALAYMQTEEAYAPPTDGALEDLTWMQMISKGYIRMMGIERFNASSLELSFAYMGDEALGGLLMGTVRYQDVASRVAGLTEDDHAMFVGISGSAVSGFRSNAFSINQDGEVYPVASRQVVFLGTPWEGKAADQVVYTLIMRMDSAIDIARPFTIVYDDGAGPTFETEYAVPEDVLAAVSERAAAARVAAEEAAAEEAAAGGAVAGGAGDRADAPGPSTAESSAAGPAGAAGEAVATPSNDGPAEPSVSAPEAAATGATASAPGAAGSTGAAGPAGAAGSGDATGSTAGGGAAAGPAQPSDAPDELALPEGVLDLAVDAPPPSASATQSVPALDFSSFEDFEDETALSQLLLETRWAPVIRLILLLALVLYAFFVKTKTWVRAATLGVTLIYLGFIDGGFLSVSHIASGFTVGPAFYIRDMALLFMVGFTVITTLLWGRVFCGFLCPFGALQDLITHLVPKRFQRALPQRVHDWAIYLKYGVLLLIIGLAAAPAHIGVYQYFEPFGTVFYLSTSPLLWSIAGGFLVASTVVPRFYCRYACPLGAALGVASYLSIFRIRRVEQCVPCKVCQTACPTGAIRGPDVDFEECVRCNVCETKLLTKAGVCRHSMDVVRSRLVQLETSAQ